MSVPLRCRCGKLQGELDPAGVAARAVCYCKDCQAFARFLEREGGAPDVLEDAGGTEVAASLPGAVHLTGGLEHLACMSLSPRGLYRWYASCCGTPVGNTPRDPKTAYVGMVRACLAAPAATLDRELGASHVVVETGSALSPVQSTPARTAWAVVKIGTMILRARLGGGYRANPFFRPASNEPLRQPRVLTRDERAALSR